MPNLARFRELLQNTPLLRGGCGFAARVSLSCPVILLSCRQGILAHDTVKIVYVAHVGNLKNVKDLQGDTNISV